MASKVIGAKRKYKHYKLPFLTSNDDHVKRIKFTNYDRYDRKEGLKKFLDASYVRYKLDADEDMEAIENSPLLRKFFVAGQSSYCRMMNAAMNTFVGNDQKLTGTNIRGVNDPHPRVLVENPNSYALFFCDYYKYDNKNPGAKYLNDYIGLGGKKNLSCESESKFRERVEKGKKSSERDQRKRVEMVAMMIKMMMMMNLMIMIIASIEIVKVTSYRLLKEIEMEVEIPS